MTNTYLKSVHITNYYHKNSGGISTSYNNLLAAAERHKKFIRLIVPGETETIEEVNDFAKIYYVPAKYSPIFDKRYRLIMPWQYMPSSAPLREILMAEMPDIIEVTDKYTLSMMGAMVRKGKFRQLNRPMLVHFSCERMDDNIASFITKKPFGKWLARRLIGNYTLPSFDFHLANSAYNAKTFAEFAEEIRVDKRSEIVLMPEYKQPLHSRQLQSFAEILKHYPEFPEGRQKWFDRVYYDIGDGDGTRKLSVYWINGKGSRVWLQMAIRTLAVFGSSRMRPAFRLTMKCRDIVPKDISKTKFEVPDLHEIAASLAAEQAPT